MDSLLIGLVGALMATNQPAAVSNLVFKHTGEVVEFSDVNIPLEPEFRKLMEDDDAAHDEVDKWIRENQKFTAEGAGVPPAEMNQRILSRFEPVRKAYEDFIEHHPNHSRARIAYASFLNDLGEEEASFEQLDKARALDPRNPAIWNNIANYYGHNGGVKMAFECYAKAIELNTNEPVYYHNFGTTVFLYRKDAREFYNITEQQVFDKALELYSRAMKLSPDDFPLASDIAQTYYGITPMRTNEALLAWTNALKIAHNQVEREGVYIHLARIKMMAGRYSEAAAFLNSVTNENYGELKKRVANAVGRRIAEAAGTNASSEDKSNGNLSP